MKPGSFKQKGLKAWKVTKRASQAVSSKNQKTLDQQDFQKFQIFFKIKVSRKIDQDQMRDL
jgi:hypothetical protein